MAVLRPDRLISLRKEMKFSQTTLAQAVGVGQSTIARWEAEGTRNPREILELARALECSTAYLLGESDERGEFLSEHRVPFRGAVPERDPDLVTVRQIDLSLGMGATYLDVPVTEVPQQFSQSFIRLYTKSPPDRLMFAQGCGDSMMPTLHDSDLLLIDCAQRHVKMAEQIWAIAYAGFGAIKRLRPMPDGGIKMTSDNPHVADEIAYDGELEVLGRVVAVVRKV